MDLSSYIDHTNLSKIAKVDDILKLCDEAVKYHFQSVCVYPYYVKAVKEGITYLSVIDRNEGISKKHCFKLKILPSNIWFNTSLFGELLLHT